MKKTLKAVDPLFLYAPIMRVDDEKREVTAYAFTSEVVDGEGGIRLKRTAMEAATPDYMQWANIRRMHQPDAVGVATSVDWDETGALMTLRVEDDDAWNKVKAGVYKGLSVGVRPTLMRGKAVEKAVWFETSLVDRPKDAGSKFIAVRAEDSEQSSDCEIEDEEESMVRGAFATYVKNYESSRLRSFAIDAFSSVIWDIQNGTATNKDQLVREACDELKNYLAPIVARGEFPEPTTTEEVTRLEDGQMIITRAEYDEAQQTISRLENELESKQDEISRVQQEATAAKEKVAALESMPPAKPVARGVFAIDKEQLQHLTQQKETLQSEQEAELQRLMNAPLDANDPEGLTRSLEISKLRMKLSK